MVSTYETLLIECSICRTQLCERLVFEESNPFTEVPSARLINYGRKWSQSKHGNNFKPNNPESASMQNFLRAKARLSHRSKAARINTHKWIPHLIKIGFSSSWSDLCFSFVFESWVSFVVCTGIKTTKTGWKTFRGSPRSLVQKGKPRALSFSHGRRKYCKIIYHRHAALWNVPVAEFFRILFRFIFLVLLPLFGVGGSEIMQEYVRWCSTQARVICWVLIQLKTWNSWRRYSRRKFN